MTGKPQYAAPPPECSGISTTSHGELPHSSSASFLPSSASASSCPDATPSDAKSFRTSLSTPPAAGFVASGASLSKSQTQHSALPPGVGLAKYVPVTYHWFYCKSRELRQIWEPLSFVDSINLEGIFRSGY